MIGAEDMSQNMNRPSQKSKKEKLIEKLHNKEYRKSFVSEHINLAIPHQLRSLRKEKGLTQESLGKKIGKAQEVISRNESANYASRFNLSTLKELAAFFDVSLIVRFGSFSDLVNWEVNLTPDSLTPKSFDQG